MQQRPLDCLRRCDGGLRRGWLAAVAGGAAMASDNSITTHWHEVLAFTDATGATFMLLLPTLRHHPLCVSCRTVNKINRFPCEGNVIA